MYQLLRATKFIHSGGVIHRDQKPSNILLDASCLVKLCDFGLARPLGGLPEGPEGPALTDYVATRWYRAPEVLLSSSWYTPGVDMWSLGCVLGEMLRGRPLFPGTSTLHQLELILETIPPPSKEDLLALSSSFSASVLPCLGSRPRQTLDALLPPDTPPEALDLLKGLLVFAPGKRLSAAQALRHPYVQRFHCPAREQTLDAAVRLPVLEGVQLSAPEYRSRVYQMILERRGGGPVPRGKGPGGTPPGAEPSAPRAQARLRSPRAVPQLSPGSPSQKPGADAQSSLGQQSAHDPTDVPCGAENLPRPDAVPLLQPPPPGGLGRAERPPGVTPQAPSGHSWVKPSVKGAAPSLASQAAARVAVQALIRSDWNPGRGVRASGARRVSPPGPPTAPPAPRPRPLARPPDRVRVPRGLPADARPEPRPGRRMFGASAWQGAQGAARAALGGSSQAYGTVCHSALGRLLLLPGPARKPPCQPAT
ncbi:mitogen-activated protein kinase 15 isoform X2 [Prionailurus bengalensis]|nr:mitogen-activated protein kinase 15 isoform X2 [Prionailurus bengalensis]